MNGKYYIVIEKEKGSCFGAYSPDFKTCMAAGDTREEALQNMKEALEVYLENSDRVPKASSLDEVEDFAEKKYPKASRTVVCPVEVALPVSRAVRINISISENLLRRMDEKLAKHRDTRGRSRFIARAVEKQLVAE